MPGCSNHCAFYWEEHSIDNVDSGVRRIIRDIQERGIESVNGDLSCLLPVVKKICLKKAKKSENELLNNCRHYQYVPEDLSIQDRINILNQKASTKWKRLTLIVTILGIALSAFLAYLNFSKPDVEQLKNRTELLEMKIIAYEKELKESADRIRFLENNVN